MCFLQVQILACLAAASLAGGSEVACATPLECADDEKLQEMSLLQHGLLLETLGTPRAIKSPQVASGKGASAPRRGSHKRGSRAQHRAMDPALLLEGAHTAGLPWTLADATRSADHNRRARLALAQVAAKQVRGHNSPVTGVEGVTTEATEEAKDRLTELADECKKMNQAIGFNGCLSSLAPVLGQAAKLFFNAKNLTLKDAWDTSTTVIIEGLNMVFPVVGMIASIASSFVTGLLFPGDGTDPYMVAIQEVAELVLEKAAIAATNNLLSTVITSHSSELRAISEDLAFMPEMLLSEDESAEAAMALFNFNLVMLHEISKLGEQIRTGALADIAGDQWSYEIMALAAQAAQLEAILMLQIADHDLVHKGAVQHRIRLKFFGSGGWAEWFEEHFPKAIAYINDEFDKCALSPTTVSSSYDGYSCNGPGNCQWSTFTTCSVSQNDNDCKDVLGMDLYDTIGCSTEDGKRLCTASTSCSICGTCRSDPHSCGGRNDICTDCHRDVERNRMLNSFEELRMQWMGIFGMAGGVGQFKEDQFEVQSNMQACAGSYCNPITSQGKTTFSDCWEHCFSTATCAAVEFGQGKHCADHSSMVNVLGTNHSNRPNTGKYFNFMWNTWMTGDGYVSGSGRIMNVRQCRGGVEVWVGDVKVWNTMAAGQDIGDSHGRRASDVRDGQWAEGDKIYPSIYPCGVQMCTCNLVTGLGDMPLSVSPISDWAVYTGKVHDVSTNCNA